MESKNRYNQCSLYYFYSQLKTEISKGLKNKKQKKRKQLIYFPLPTYPTFLSVSLPPYTSHFPLRMCISLIVCISLRVYILHSPLHMYLTPYSVCTSLCISHSVYTPLRVYPTLPCIPHSSMYTYSSVYTHSSVSITLYRVYLTLLFVSHYSVCIPLLCVCPTPPCLPHSPLRVYPTLPCVPHFHPVCTSLCMYITVCVSHSIYTSL